MIIKLLTEHHLEFLSLKEAAEARPSLHLSKCQIVGNPMPGLKLSSVNNVQLFLAKSAGQFYDDRQIFTTTDIMVTYSLYSYIHEFICHKSRSVSVMYVAMRHLDKTRKS